MQLISAEKIILFCTKNNLQNAGVPILWILMQNVSIVHIILISLFSKIILGGPSVQNPDALTTSGQFSCSNHKYFNNKDLIPAKDGQITPAKDGQRHWLFQQGLLCMKIRLT